MKSEFSKFIKGPGGRTLVLGGLLLMVFTWGYRHYVNTVQRVHYQIFDVKKTVSWVETPEGIYRKSAKGDLDSILLSADRWKEFTLSFDLIHPRNAGLIFHYQDNKNFDFIVFNKHKRAILLGRKRQGHSRYLEQATFPLAAEQKCSFTVKAEGAQLFVNKQSVFKIPPHFQGGKFGLLLKDAFDPRTIFHNSRIEGRLADGSWITAQSPSSSSASGHPYFLALLPFYMGMILLSVYLATCFRRYYGQRKICYPGQQERGGGINIMTASLVHLLLAVCLFWPFLSRGEILISSYDNFGEIFPLFFLSKHNFMQILGGQSLSLWNPYVHNGIPFFSNHWNMIYYPANWVVFLFSDKNVLSVLTLRTFMEVFLTGVCAYGFFARELRSKAWALFCSIIYQLGSLLIFSLTVFPTISLYFAMTLYLYLLWSLEQRRAVWNYVGLTFSVILVLTSANMAFIFYAVLSLGVVSVYRFVSLKKRGGQALTLAAFSFLTGLLISAVRIFPCLGGIASSNRIVSNYYTLHDRVAMILRLFIPEITGWFGPNTFNALTSKNLQLMFEQMDLPSNSQNTFFVYFGILAALLLVISLLMRTRGGHTFWKIYAWSTIAIALLFQPFWGILSILFFPFNHYSYHTIILPVGICALVGHTGIYLETTKIRLDRLRKYFFFVLLLVQCYILVFVTYLFPQMTIYTRSFFLVVMGGYAAYLILKKYYRATCKLYLSLLITLFNAFIWVLLFFAGTVVLLKPIPTKEWLAGTLVIPFLSLLAVGTAALYLYAGWAKQEKTVPLAKGRVYAFLFLVPVLTGLILSSPLLTKMLYLEESYRTYFLDLLLGHLKFFLIAQIGILGIVLARVKLLSKGFVMTLFILVTALDLLAFNFRFDNVVAPFSQQKAFYQSSFPYRDINNELREQMDLLNYRVSALDKGGLNSNKSLIFSVPSYTGIIGYMPKRFSNFINQFGYPKGTILLYPADSTDDERFLDLSAVKYVFQDEDNVITRPTALARLNLFYSYEVIEDEQALLNHLKDKSFDPRKNVLLSQGPPEGFFPKFGRPAKFVPITHATGDQVKAQVKTNIAGIVLFNESFDEGWRAFVDDVQVPIMIANYNFMACLVPQGHHQIRFQYEPQKFYLALKVSMAGIILFVLGIFLGLMRKKRGKIN